MFVTEILHLDLAVSPKVELSRRKKIQGSMFFSLKPLSVFSARLGNSTLL